MARTQATQVENNFTLGLITEKTALSFPENAAYDTDNCVFNQKGNVTRRLGLDLETSSSTSNNTIGTDAVYNTFLWEAVSGSGEISFLVVQQYQTLHFYNVSTSVTPSANKHAFTIDLTTFLPLNSTQNPGAHNCDYASGNGDLIVVNAVCDQFYISYDIDTDTFTATEFQIKYRDFDGATDEYADSLRPTWGSISALVFNAPNHGYNLYNQGWGQSDALAQWIADAAHTTVPSNQDQVAMFRTSETDAYDPAKYLAKSPGNSLAPKGHFILDAANPQRARALANDGISNIGLITDDNVVVVSNTAGTFYSFGSKLNANTANVFDLNTSQTAINCGLNSVTNISVTVGKNFTGAPKVVNRVILYSSTNTGYHGATGTGINFNVYGKSSGAPSSETDGTLLFSTTINNAFTQLTNSFFFSNFTPYDYYWVRATDAGAVVRQWYISEMKMYEQIDTEERFSTVAFLSGRVFYSGTKNVQDSNKIYFSQIVSNQNQYGRCYQKNDPSNEYYFELLSDDGGVIRILEMGEVVKLYPLRSSIVVFATNGIWLIGGSSGIKATDFTVKKLSSLGTTSPRSIVDVKGIPVWWAEDGIYTMEYDPNYDSFQIRSLTQTTIKEFFTNIPIANRQQVKGTYDILNEIIYWVYNDATSLTSANYYKFNKVLCLNTISKAFYPWTFGDGPSDNKFIRDIRYVASADRLVPGKVKLLYTTPFSGTVDTTSFAEFYKDTYLDWTTEDYISYFTTGYKVHGQAQRFFQFNYVLVYLNTITNSSCYMHTRFDWTNSGDSSKWSSVQQIYNPSFAFRDVNFRRLKVRGKGRSAQLHFTSETGKPFDIIGWSIYETGNEKL